MYWSKGYFHTIKENPSDAEIPSHRLLVRAGFIKKEAQGLYTYGPLAVRVIRNLEKIIRKELSRVGMEEVLLPIVQPKELWEESGRWSLWGQDLLKFKNRSGQEWCLGATHEEVITDYVRRDVKSYRDLPVSLYQINTKYRDEIRPRFGLLRCKEFIMKDGYSFDSSEEESKKSYLKMQEAYVHIFDNIGVDYRIVDADTGSIGGRRSQEFHILAESGEDHLLVSDGEAFAANIEICPTLPGESDLSEGQTVEYFEIEKFETPRLKSIGSLSKALNIKEKHLVKSFFLATKEFESTAATDQVDSVGPILILLRGDDEVNLIKIKNSLNLPQLPRMLTDEEILKLTGAHPGSCGPVNLEIPIFVDHGLNAATNFIVGANEDGYHFKNVNFKKDFKVTKFLDLRVAKEGDPNPVGKGRLKSFRGIEVGHIFDLGTKYSESMKACFLNQAGKLVPMEMGCYGLGVSRTVQAVVEQQHDKDGIIWPLSLAPFAVHICLLDPSHAEAALLAKEICELVIKNDFDCLIDDREERPGIKFKDADLLGMPLRINIGARGLAEGIVEMVERNTKKIEKIESKTAPKSVMDWLKRTAE